MLWNERNLNKFRGGLVLLGDVIEFGIVEKGLKNIVIGLLDFNRVKLEGLRDLVNKISRDSL